MIPKNENVKAPCKNCTRRKIGCHGSCSDYLHFKIAADKLHKQEKQLALAHVLSIEDVIRYKYGRIR